MKKIGRHQYVSKAQRRASKLSERTDRALNLSYLVVRNGKLVKVRPDGTSVALRKARFNTIKVDKDKFTLVDE